ncbi:unnamed protein product [Sphenostylis stenocarpa]|uniref:Uncharacterized protein n=1 Tax=Sphenostylis stenocarpa TaxID=92480 RepID=A0AA86VFB5_9FABA|nr:unnamed protein product [Sphenostylis stenocarpa]
MQHQLTKQMIFQVNVNSALQFSSSQRRLLRDENHHVRKHRMLTSIANIFKLQRLTPFANLASPSTKHRQKTVGIYELSHFVPSSVREKLRKPFHCFYSKKIDWPSLGRSCKQWIKNPFNMTLLLWIICVAVSVAIIFLVMTGVLNKILTKQSQRNSWFEVEAKGRQNPKKNILPVFGVGICISIAIAALALAGVYCISIPLGKEYEIDEEAQNQIPISNTFGSRNDQSMATIRIDDEPELRTTEFHDIVADNFFCQKQTKNCVQPALNSFPPQDKAPQVTSNVHFILVSEKLSFQEKETKMSWKRLWP